jgi:putative hydrolase of HD superfamily
LKKGDFLKISSIINIRHVPRTGWVLRGVPPAVAETISDHIFLVTLLSLKISEDLMEKGFEVDVAKTLTMSLVHDLPEAVTGDIVRYVKEEEPSYFKIIEEKSLESLGMGKYIPLYKDFEERESLESIIVKLSDYLATIIEGRRLVALGYRDVEEIVENMENLVKNILKSLTNIQLRDALEKTVIDVLKN